MIENDLMKKRPMTLRLWLAAIDPGLIRLLPSGRAALALLSIWLVLRAAVGLLFSAKGPPIPLYGVFSGIIFLLFIIDLKPSDRKLSLLLAPIPFVGAVLLASVLKNYYWLNTLIQLLLFFFSYFFRRYGARAGELALVGTLGFYIGSLLHPPLAFIPMFAAVIVVSVAIIYLWEFVLIPYNPTVSLHRGVIAFYHNVALTVASTRQGLENGQENSQYSKKLQRQLKQVHQNRRVIEGLFAAIVSPKTWSQDRLTRLQVEMFKTERGLELLIEAATQLASHSGKLPREILQVLSEGLELLESNLWGLASEPVESRVSEVGDWLPTRVKSSLEGKTSDEWVYAVVRVGVAASQLARSVTGIRAIESDWLESKQDFIQTKSPTLPSKPSGNPGTKSKYAFHPTTILGFQAVLATGLAMLVAFLLKVDQPNLVYWTAFVVIAGSTGESLRRISLRVVGVLAGTVLGVALAILLPDNLVLTALFVTACIFMMTYSIPVSYIRMVFWLNIAMMLIITTLGGPALDLLIVRPVNTMLGAAIAALIVVFVLPIHVQDRFAAALSNFLAEVDRYVEVYVATMLGSSSSADLKAEELKIDAGYKKLELALPNVAFEYNPLSRAQSPLASQATSLAVLSNYVTHLNDDVGGDPGSLANVRNNELISEVQCQIHAVIQALNGHLANRQGKAQQSAPEMDELARREDVLENILATEAGSTEAVCNRALYHLKRIYDTITQIASGVGALAASNERKFADVN
jgi:uncharacterized membrane protein YgaE (UPF0421/DUF939 family)